MSNSVGKQPPGSSSNNSPPAPIGTNSTSDSGSSAPVPVSEESSPVNDDDQLVNADSSASPQPSINLDSPPTPSSPPPTNSNPPPPTPVPSSPPPSNSKSSPPPSPPLVSNSSAPSITSPPPKSSPNSPPPSPNPPPTPAKKESPPPPVQSPPPPPASPPPPAAFFTPPLSGGSQKSPPPPAESKPSLSPPILNLSPKSSDSNSTPSNEHNPTESGFRSPPVPVTSPSGHSSPTSSDVRNSKVPVTPPGNESNGAGSKTVITVAVAAVAGLVIMGLIVAIFLVARKSRKRREPYASGHYMPPKSHTVKTGKCAYIFLRLRPHCLVSYDLIRHLFPVFPIEDGYYYGQQQQSVGFAGPGSHSYRSQTAQSDSYGSQRGNIYNGGGPDSGVIGSSKTFFSYHELMEITNGFAHQNIIGEGGFGCVFKGCMPDGKVVAVKQLKAGSGQGEREFKAEVEIISRVHHRHLVSLVGYCISDNQRLLIYEFVPNKTLEHHLHGKVADFGLARLNDSTQTHVSTRVMGTFGYLAPEYASSGKLTDRSDVYSFGVVLLELITGRKPVDASQPLGDESLVEWARPLLIHALETGELGELVDPRLEKHYVESELFRMVETAAACVRHSAPKRPRMVQVVRALDSEGELSDLSNGVKFGQSTVYDSGQYNQEIRNFRRMAIGSNGSSEFDTFSGDHSGRDTSHEPPTSSEYTSSESETLAMNRHGSYGGRRF
ncbi:unnamed protein product [Dovyalis caffra]|uniref:non-specific serine/threonine protein kinase n=1 Tax=Dovyalis caffra TaxID=77055 RepID=A0AAV1RG22_9ROSI|nr:unnamed protein product [Dovyalis caffra]